MAIGAIIDSPCLADDISTVLSTSSASFESPMTEYGIDAPTDACHRDKDGKKPMVNNQNEKRQDGLGVHKGRDDLEKRLASDLDGVNNIASVDDIHVEVVGLAAADREAYGSHVMAKWVGQPSIRGGSEALRMVLLTFNSIGITFTWGVEMTYCTPYLLSLGLTKSQTSLVWIAGPLSGLLVQPVIGVLADESRSKWGRRRPIIIGASLVVSMSMLVLGFTKEIVAWFVPDPSNTPFLTIGLAVLSLYVTDFAINAVMSCSRSLVVDTLPIQKQQSGGAWGTRMGSLGHIIGYGMGAVDLVKLFGTTLGDTQFKQLTIIASLTMIGTSCVTCWAVTERVLVASGPRRPAGPFNVFRQIWSTLLTLPPRVRAICWVVFWTWIAWYPFHIYSSTWVGETYFRYDVPASASPAAVPGSDVLGDMGRIGSTALAVYSMTNFCAAWLIPPLVRSPDEGQAESSFRQKVPWLALRYKPDLLTAWFWCHLMFASAMFLTPFAASFRFATFLVALCGVPWTVAMWAPHTFMGVEVNKLSAAGVYRRLGDNNDAETAPIEMLDARGMHDHDDADDDYDAAAPLNATTTAAVGQTGELSGAYFGILNIYSTIPQFISTFLSTAIFSVLEPGKSPELHPDGDVPTPRRGGVNAIAVIMFISAISTLCAAYATRSLRTIA